MRVAANYLTRNQAIDRSELISIKTAGAFNEIDEHAGSFVTYIRMDPRRDGFVLQLIWLQCFEEFLNIAGIGIADYFLAVNEGRRRHDSMFLS